MATALVDRFETLVVATHNKGKLKEIYELLTPYDVVIKSADDLALPEPEETENTFAGNAILKSRAACDATGLPVISDDSGLCVDLLDGDPGIYSARWAGPTRDFNLAMSLVKDALQKKHVDISKPADVEGASAYFISVIAMSLPDGRDLTFEGRVQGHLVWPPRGDKGFGYDPMFQPLGKAMTFAEMDAVDKYAIAHRTRAFALLKSEVFERW